MSAQFSLIVSALEHEFKGDMLRPLSPEHADASAQLIFQTC